MALTPPTATATPVSQAEANAAFTVMNGFVTDAYNETLAAMQIARDQVRLCNGSIRLLDLIDSHISTLSGSSLPDPSVASDPGTKTQVNNALVTMASFIDRLNTRAQAALIALREELRLSDGIYFRLNRYDTATNALAGTLTAEAVSTDVAPGTSHTEFNTACANTTAFIDTANSEIVTTLNEFVEQTMLFQGNKKRHEDLTNKIAAMASP